MKNWLASLLILATCVSRCGAVSFFGGEFCQGAVDDEFWGRDYFDQSPWDGESNFDEYVVVDGVKFPVISDSHDGSFVLLPVHICKGEKVTPVILNGTTRSKEIIAQVYSDSYVYERLRNSPSTWYLEELWSNGPRDDRAWIWLSYIPKKTDLLASCDVSRRAAAGKYSGYTMTEYAQQFGVEFSGVAKLGVSTWFEVAIGETGEKFPTRFYCHRFGFDISQNSKLYKQWQVVADAIDGRGGNSEAILCAAAWYVSPVDVNGVEVVLESNDVRMGVVSGGGVYRDGENAMFKATPNEGCKFTGWYEVTDNMAERCICDEETFNHKVLGARRFCAHFEESNAGDQEIVSISNFYGPYIPGEKVSISIPELAGYTAKGLPSGLKLNKKTGEISGAAKKPTAADGTTVSFNKKGAETLTTKFIVGPMPTITVKLDGDTEKCKVTGGNKPYLVGAKVNLQAKAPKGTAFAGWFLDGAPWPSEDEYLNPKLKYTMTTNSLDLVAKFEKEVIDIDVTKLQSAAFQVGTAVAEGDVVIGASANSGIKSITASKLPSGLKLKQDKQLGIWYIYGTPKKAGDFISTIKVTSKSGAVEVKSCVLIVSDTSAS